jgi:hypothetical protein
MLVVLVVLVALVLVLVLVLVLAVRPAGLAPMGLSIRRCRRRWCWHGNLRRDIEHCVCDCATFVPRLPRCARLPSVPDAHYTAHYPRDAS